MTPVDPYDVGKLDGRMDAVERAVSELAREMKQELRGLRQDIKALNIAKAESDGAEKRAAKIGGAVGAGVMALLGAIVQVWQALRHS